MPAAERAGARGCSERPRGPSVRRASASHAYKSLKLMTAQRGPRWLCGGCPQARRARGARPRATRRCGRGCSPRPTRARPLSAASCARAARQPAPGLVQGARPPARPGWRRSRGRARAPGRRPPRSGGRATPRRSRSAPSRRAPAGRRPRGPAACPPRSACCCRPRRARSRRARPAARRCSGDAATTGAKGCTCARMPVQVERALTRGAVRARAASSGTVCSGCSPASRSGCWT